MSKQIAPSALVPYREMLARAVPAIAENLPKTIAATLTPERMTRLALSAITRKPQLLSCTPESIARAVIDCAALGLEPDGALGHAYFVPFGNDCQLIVGYRGFITLARRSGEIVSVEAHTIHAADKYRVMYGSAPVLEHEPLLVGERGDIVAAYCIATFTDGGKHCELMTRAEIDAVRKRSRSKDNGPWVTDFAEMARKTVVRRAAKYWPLSLELANAMEKDDGVEYGPAAWEQVADEQPKLSPAQKVKQRLKDAQNKADSTPAVETEQQTEEEVPQ